MAASDSPNDTPAVMPAPGLEQDVAPPLSISAEPPLQRAVEGFDGLQMRGLVSAPRKRSVAILAIHGMGQQVPFTTLDNLAQGLIGASQQQVKAQARTVRIGDRKLQRLELDMTRSGAAAEPVDVHVYEAYWAPLTEGKVQLLDVMRFLFSAGLNGVINSWGDFVLWMFGQRQVYRPQRKTTVQLLTALGVVLSLVAMNLVTTAVVGKYLLSGPGKWPSPQQLEALTWIMGVYIVASLLLGAMLGGLQGCKNKVADARWAWLTAVAQGYFWLWVALTMVSGVMLAVLAFWTPAWITTGADPGALALVLWAALAGVSAGVRWFLVQFLGDVAAYVSPHTLDRFQELRTQIRKVVYDTGRALYAARRKNGEFLYDEVLIVGHSLGSVAAYDALNSLLNEDSLDSHALRVAGRTGLLLTFGSPLDKVAFIFARRGATDHQRALAASVQPLITSYAQFRKMPWINIYSDRDIVSGALDYFDGRFEAAVGRPQFNTVESIADPGARIPLVAHVEYWDNPLVYQKLYEHL